ncbi:MAG: cation diffusion facilitator family transporter, partial [Gammaproteobacteria bacterium]|nr:cation diffusion facilitator family transporter [Gammaproteobacteria bacterium]
FLLLSAVERLKTPVAIESFSLGTGVIIFSIALTLLLVTFQAYVIQRTDSSALKADALHYRADLITNVGILLALAGVYYGFVFMDPMFGVLIALYIVYSAWGIAEDAIQTLLDRELPDEMRENILAVASAVTQVHSIHDLRTRRSGLTVFIQLHIELDETLTLKDAHEVADRVEFALRKAIPNADVIIHEDPISI